MTKQHVFRVLKAPLQTHVQSEKNPVESPHLLFLAFIYGIARSGYRVGVWNLASEENPQVATERTPIAARKLLYNRSNLRLPKYNISCKAGTTPTPRKESWITVISG